MIVGQSCSLFSIFGRTKWLCSKPEKLSCAWWGFEILGIRCDKRHNIYEMIPFKSFDFVYRKCFANFSDVIIKNTNWTQFHVICCTSLPAHLFPYLIVKKHVTNGAPQNFYKQEVTYSFTFFSSRTSLEEFCCLTCSWKHRNGSKSLTLTVAKILLTPFVQHFKTWIVRRSKRDVTDHKWGIYMFFQTHEEAAKITVKGLEENLVTFS